MERPRCAADARAFLGTGLFCARSACERPLRGGLQRTRNAGGLPAARRTRHACRTQHACCAFGSRCACCTRTQRVRRTPRAAPGSSGHSPPCASASRCSVHADSPRGGSAARCARGACRSRRSRPGSRSAQLGSARSAGAPSARPGLLRWGRTVRCSRIRRARPSSEPPRRAGCAALRCVSMGWSRPVSVGRARDAAAHAAPVAHLRLRAARAHRYAGDAWACTRSRRRVACSRRSRRDDVALAHAHACGAHGFRRLDRRLFLREWHADSHARWSRHGADGRTGG